MPDVESDNKAPSDSQTELLEYKLADKVMERVLSRARLLLLAFAAGLTLLGVLGTPLVIGYVSDKVVKDIQAGMEKDSEALRRRLADSLATLNITSAEILKTAEEARAKLKRLEQDYASIEAVNSRYLTMRAE